MKYTKCMYLCMFFSFFFFLLHSSTHDNHRLHGARCGGFRSETHVHDSGIPVVGRVLGASRWQAGGQLQLREHQVSLFRFRLLRGRALSEQRHVDHRVVRSRDRRRRVDVQGRRSRQRVVVRRAAWSSACQ